MTYILKDTDIKRLIAALRYTNQQLSALVSAVESPDFYNLPGALEDSRTTFERVNDFQMRILDDCKLTPGNLPAYNWDSD